MSVTIRTETHTVVHCSKCDFSISWSPTKYDIASQLEKWDSWYCVRCGEKIYRHPPEIAKPPQVVKKKRTKEA